MLCGEDHEWQDCPTLEGKFVRKKVAACVEYLNDEFESLAVDSSIEKHAAELAVPDVCWQTHEPLCLASVEWDQHTPLRLACMHAPALSRRLVYRCKIEDKSACCLFDIGANYSLMSWAWAKKNNIPCKVSESVVRTAAQDETIKVYDFAFEIGDWQLLHDLAVLCNASSITRYFSCY